MDAQQTPASLEKLVGVIRRRWLLITLCAVIAAGAAFAFTRTQAMKYTATASLIFNTSQQSAVTGLPAASANSQQTEQNTNLQLTQLDEVAEKTATTLGGGLTKAAVKAAVSVSGRSESSIVDVSATATSPALAARLANTYASQFVNEQQTATREYYSSALAVINKQLAQGGSIALQERATALQLLAQLPADVRVAQPATPPTSPSSPKASRNTLLGAFLGLLLGLGLAFLAERSDPRMQEVEEFEAIYRLPLLGVVPESVALSQDEHDTGRPWIDLPPTEAEVFNLIRAHLRSIHGERPLHSVLIASATAGDGKTTVASHLAAAAARMGSRVLLIEADLRHPTLAQRLGIPSTRGLSDVLTQADSLGEAVQPVDLSLHPGGVVEQRVLDVLVAGQPLPMNPAELIESRAMESALTLAKSTYDLVVIDTPPLTAVSDAFPLLRMVDGVIVVGWVGRTPRDVSTHLQQTLTASGARLLGVVANGIRAGAAGPYNTGAYIAREPAAVLAPPPERAPSPGESSASAASA
jgi:capsular exopolysaccharide synthesis family protein